MRSCPRLPPRHPGYRRCRDVFVSFVAPNDLWQARMWKRIQSESYVVHLWNKKTASLRPDPGSVLYRLLQAAPDTDGHGPDNATWAHVDS